MASDLIAAAFGKDFNLYATVLRCSETATASHLRKAYHKRALEFHPDKQSSSSTPAELELATKRFQAVSAAYEILKDGEKRKAYDATGELDDGILNENSLQQWTELFRAMFKQVSTKDIDAFGANYKKSEEEAADVLKYYSVYKGDLNKMLSCVMLSEEEDVQRWVRHIIEPAISRGDVPRYEAFDRTMQNSRDLDMDDDDDDVDERGTSEKKRPKTRVGKAAKLTKKDNTLAKKQKEEKEAAELFAKICGRQSGALAKREAAFGDMISDLENKYANSGTKGRGKKGKGKKSSVLDDIPDDEFERIQARLMARKAQKT